ncbi:MAG: hypothetical protein LBB75_00035 [Oscillospiraceae bacterium]|jgi:hypothetical protein|nr:hypothetical protein [Oscillospiraceae bacterium]
MRNIKKKDKVMARPDEGFRRAPVPQPPRLPETQRAFFDILLGELAGGLQDSEKELRKLARHEGELLRKNSRLRGTVAYARALLRLEEICRADQPPKPEQADISSLLNLAVNSLRRSFLYAGVAVRRPGEEPSFAVRAPKRLALFLLEEMLACCLRCAPEGRNLYISLRPIGEALLLGVRTEGPALQQSPLIPSLYRPGEPEDAPAHAEDGAQEDYGFAMCRVLAAKLGWAFRWEADEAGVRMFVDIARTGE